MNLAETTASYLEQFPGGAMANIQRQEQMLEKFGRIAFGGFGLVLLTAIGAIIYLIVTRMILTGVNFWSGILLVAFVVFASLSLAYVFFRESINEKKQKFNSQLIAPELKSPSAFLELERGNFQPASSIVEDTTELLPVERGTRKLQ